MGMRDQIKYLMPSLPIFFLVGAGLKDIYQGKFLKHSDSICIGKVITDKGFQGQNRLVKTWQTKEKYLAKKTEKSSQM